MSNPNVTLRVSGSLREHLEECTGPHGLYETPSEYLRDLIRRDMEKRDAEKWERLRTALAEGLSVEESDYRPLSSEGVKQRARKRHSPLLVSGKYRFSPTAAAQLDALSDYGYRRFGAQQADNYIDGLFASIQEAANSKSYKGLPLKQVPPDKLTGITTLSIYYLLYKKHYLYFRTLSDGALGVVCILGGRMDTPRRLKEQLSPPVTDIE